jgi:hypothetical protein
MDAPYDEGTDARGTRRRELVEGPCRNAGPAIVVEMKADTEGEAPP